MATLKAAGRSWGRFQAEGLRRGEPTQAAGTAAATSYLQGASRILGSGLRTLQILSHLTPDSATSCLLGISVNAEEMAGMKWSGMCACLPARR